MGSPIVFQTAPPQPASNARITCPAVFVGGPEASQNGFGLVSPANFTFRSAMFHQHLSARVDQYSFTQASGLEGLYRATSRAGSFDDCAPRGEPNHVSKPRA